MLISYYFHYSLSCMNILHLFYYPAILIKYLSFLHFPNNFILLLLIEHLSIRFISLVFVSVDLFRWCSILRDSFRWYSIFAVCETITRDSLSNPEDSKHTHTWGFAIRLALPPLTITSAGCRFCQLVLALYRGTNNLLIFLAFSLDQ